MELKQGGLHNDLLAEIVENTREQLRREELRIQRADTIDEKMEAFTKFFDKLSNSVPRTEQASGVINSVLTKLGAEISHKDAVNLEDVNGLIGSIREIQNYDKNFTHAMLNPEKEINEN